MARSHEEIAMAWLAAALEETADYPHPESLDALRSHIDPQWIEEALAATGTATLRRRRLPAEQVIWLVIGMAMRRDRPIHEMASRLELVLPDRNGDTDVSSGTVVQARKKVGEEPVRWLFERTAHTWAHDRARDDEWRGLSLYAVDGTTLRVPDSDENREYFGLAKGDRGDSGYPLVKMAALMAVRSHLIAAAHFTPYATSELSCAQELWEEIPDRSLVILDRLYLSAKILLGIQEGGSERHWLVRTKTTTKWTVLESFGRFDKLVELKVSSEARRKDPSLPRTYIARAISYRHPDSKGRQWLLTSLRDPEAYPADEVVAMYHERWEIELGYDEIKTHMLEREEAIRSRTVIGVKQELWGILLAFNLVRLEMAKIADEAEVPAWRISFMMALRLIRDEWDWCAIGTPGSVPKKLRRMREKVKQFVLPPRRSERRNRREVKIKMSNYPKKSRPPPKKRGTAKKRRKKTTQRRKKPN